jgi:hypothetical protein
VEVEMLSHRMRFDISPREPMLPRNRASEKLGSPANPTIALPAVSPSDFQY